MKDNKILMNKLEINFDLNSDGKNIEILHTRY